MKHRLSFGTHPLHATVQSAGDFRIELRLISQYLQVLTVYGPGVVNTQGLPSLAWFHFQFQYGAPGACNQRIIALNGAEYRFELVSLYEEKLNDSGHSSDHGRYYWGCVVEFSQVVHHDRYSGPTEPKLRQVKLKVIYADESQKRELLYILSNGADVYAGVPGKPAKRTFHASGLVQTRATPSQEVTNRSRLMKLKEFRGEFELFRVALGNDPDWLKSEKHFPLYSSKGVSTTLEARLSEFEIGIGLVFTVGVVSPECCSALLGREYGKYEVHRASFDKQRTPWLYGLILRERLLGSLGGNPRIASLYDQLADGGVMTLISLDPIF